MKDDTSSAVQTEHRRLAAIMFTDIVGFSRQMGTDEARMLRLLEVHNQMTQQTVAAQHGHVIKTIGDAFLVDFPSVVNAVQCAQSLQMQFRTHNAEKAPTEQIHVRIGLHLGDIVQRDGDVFGDGVNIASRLQTLAEPDTICLSQKVYEEVEKKLPLGTVVSLGRPKLKNIAPRFKVYALLPEQAKGLRQTLRVQRLKFSRRVSTALPSLSYQQSAQGRGTMKFSLFYQLPCAPGQSEVTRYQETLDQIAYADELGFDVAWLAELHFYRGFSIMPTPPHPHPVPLPRGERGPMVEGTGYVL